MPDIFVGPQGLAMDPSGTIPCAPTTNTTTTTMLPAIKDMLQTRFFTGLFRARPRFIDIQKHLPLKPSSRMQITGTSDIKYWVGYTNTANDRRGRIDLTPGTFNATGNFSSLDNCGVNVPRSIAMTLQNNARGCAPGGVDAPLPIVGSETYSREAFGTILHLPPICTQEYIQKAVPDVTAVVSGYFEALEDQVRYMQELEEVRWVISKTRYNISAYASPSGSGQSRMVDNESAIQAFSFPFIPNHWGSPAWFATMLNYTDLDPFRDITVDLPMSILNEYKKWINQVVGVVFMGNTAQFTGDLNRYTADVLHAEIIWYDTITNRKITFRRNETPVYVEVSPLGTDSAEWFFQEMWGTRLNDAGTEVLPGKFNPKYGVQCSCPDNVIAALITVSYGDAFHKEPMPNTPPASTFKSVFSRMPGFDKLNVSLAEVWPATMQFRVFTGLQAEQYVLNPWRAKMAAAGHPCDKINNMMDTWLGGYAYQGAVYVEDYPRNIANFLLAVPQTNYCVDTMTVCPNPATAPDPIEVEPGDRTTEDVQVDLPPAPEPSDPPAGTLFAPKGKTVQALCDGNELEFTMLFKRRGGTFGALEATIAANVDDWNDPYKSLVEVPTTVTFADGETQKTITITIPGITCGSEGAKATQKIVLTYTGDDLDEDSYETATVCVLCADADTCVDPDCQEGGGCVTC